MSNGVLILVIKLVVNVLFSGDAAGSVAEILRKAPAFARPLIEQLIAWLPSLSTPKSTMGLVLVISTVPVVMLFRNIFGYLNAYLMSWAGLRAVADLRSALFGHLQNLSLAFFSQARTGAMRAISNSRCMATRTAAPAAAR
jgi:ABC-type multidrug transport system fused ATPase/permease subunit